MKYYRLKNGMLVKESTILRWQAQAEAAELIRSSFPATDHRERDLRRRQNRAKRKKEKRAVYLAQIDPNSFGINPDDRPGQGI